MSEDFKPVTIVLEVGGVLGNVEAVVSHDDGGELIEDLFIVGVQHTGQSSAVSSW